MPSTIDTTLIGTKRLACVGEAMVELTFNKPGGHIGFSGDVLNTAIYLSRENQTPAKVDFVSVVGKDAMSAELLAFARSEGVETESVTIHANRLCGIYAISTDTSGERRFDYWRDRSAARTLFQDGFEALANHDVIYLGGITLAIIAPDLRGKLIDYLGAHPATVIFDSNYRPALWEDKATAQTTIEAMWRVTDIALASVDDEMALFGDPSPKDVVERLRSWGLSQGCIKCGAQGVLPLSAQVAAPRISPVQNVIDTTAAGDSFNGAYIAALMRGTSEADAIQAGSALAAHVIQHPGAIVPRVRTP